MPEGIYSPSSRLKRQMAQQPAQLHKTQPGFEEMWEMSLNLTAYEHLSFSKDFALKKYRDKRNGKIFEAYRNGEIPKETFFAFVNNKGRTPTHKINLLAAYLKNKRGMDVETDEDLIERVRKDLSVVRDAGQEMLGRASTFGKIGYFAGMAHADMIDPTMWPGFLMGYGAPAASATLLSRMLTTGAKVGLTMGGLEAVRQFEVYDWQQQLGSQYDLSDAITTIAMTAGLTGGMTASAEALAAGIKSLMRLTPKRKIERIAREHLDRAFDEMIDAPDPTMSAVEHAKNIDDEIIRQENLRPDEPYVPSTQGGKVFRTTADGVFEEIEVPVKTYKVNEAGKVEMVESGTTTVSHRVKPEPRNVTRDPAVNADDLEDAVVEAAYSDLIRENPDARVPTGELKVGEYGPEPINRKLSEVVDENNKAFQNVNLYKECLIRGR
jgi:hypothetical protein